MTTASNIYYELAQDGAERPYIVLLQDSNEPHNTHNGPSTFDRVQCRVLTFSDRYVTSGGVTGAKTLADSVRTALDYYYGTGIEVYFQNETTEAVTYKGNLRAYMVEQTYDVWLNR